ncbi:hypothetical protein GCK72_023528 [Caenorhabditis remanei]|nr:hypothetical protein GCK72_023528 [Caenorhabditis remanei]KAF1747069.1 hypothetical protein GCK72_023528 [Caenorhabditis remanei]
MISKLGDHPVDSLVYGGNFLLAENFYESIRIAKFEKKCLKNGSKDMAANNTFPNFWNTWSLYLEICVLKDLKNGTEEEKRTALRVGKKMYDEFKTCYRDFEGWYSTEETIDMLTELHSLLSEEYPNIENIQ